MASAFKIIGAVVLLSGVGLHAPRVDRPATKLSDDIVVDNVERELRSNVRLRDLQIEVLSADGVVRLVGSVSNLVEKQRVEQLALASIGVRSVDNQLSVQDPQTVVGDINAALKQAFAADRLLQNRELSVVSNRGVVSIGGAVDTPYLRNHAERLARRVPGVVMVRNEIRVQERSDELLQRLVLNELKNDELFESLLVNVRVEKQVVMLRGYVESPLHREWAEARAGAVSGVLSVDNRLVVAHSPGRSHR